MNQKRALFAGLLPAALLLGCLAEPQDSREFRTVAQQTAQDQDQKRDLDVPYVPTPEAVVDAMLKMADIKKGEKMYDLGCGDGRIVVAAARLGATGVGVDLDPQRIKESNENAKKAGVTDRVKFLVGDLFSMDFKDADVVTMYLLHSVNMDLRPIILNDLRPGTRIVSHDFDMGDWEPDKQMEVGSYRNHNVYFWVVPAKVAGTWTWTGPNQQRYTMSLDQTHQKLNGMLKAGDRRIDLRAPKLNGAEITFDAVDNTGARTTHRFTGKVDGNRITGTFQDTAGGSQPVAWTATRS